ncbi:MAG: hypothetical protein JOY99_01525 [Sphingomonadaceae bacterium]|nr:hypothetical protein [Sphingomonadaceae bacterium]
MKRITNALLAAAMLAAPLGTTAAVAQDWHHNGGGDWHGGPGDRGPGGPGGPDRGWHGDQHGWDPRGSYHYDNHYRPRRLGRDDYVYRGGDGRYYCRRSDGTTGLVLGAIGGGVLGGAVGGNTLGALLGAAGGGLLGRSIDRGNISCR